MRNRISGIQRLFRWLAQPFQFPNAGIGSLHDRGGRKLLLQNPDNDPTNFLFIQPLREDLEEHQVSVAVHNQTRQFIGFAEDQPASVGSLLHHVCAQLNRVAQALLEQCQPI